MPLMALDLTREFPRSAFEQLLGFAWLPRLIDKVRAAQAGTLGEYAAYPCPGDRNFLATFGVEAEALQQLIHSGAEDGAIAEWVQAQAKSGDEATKRRYLLRLHDTGNPLFALVARLYAFSLRGAIRQQSPQVALWSLDTFAKVTAAEEGHPIPPAPVAG